MKKILIANNNMKVGGIQKSLVNLLANIHEEYDITLVLFNTGDVLQATLPESVRVIGLDYPIRHLGVSHTDASRAGVWTKLSSTILRGLARIGLKSWAMRYITMRTKKLAGHYDVAISYTQNVGKKLLYGGSEEYILRKVSEDKKVAFIHCDYQQAGVSDRYNNHLLTQFDQVVTVSNACKDRLLGCVPELDGRVVAVPNFIDTHEIESKKSEYSVDYDPSYTNILTVARLSAEKGLLRPLPAIRELVDSGKKVRWYIVGGGDMQSVLVAEIERLGLGDNVILVGERSNPYPYYVGADVFMLTSYHEAEPIVLKEAMYFRVPIFTTDTVSAKEIVNAGCGVVSESEDITDDLVDYIESARYLEIRAHYDQSYIDRAKQMQNLKQVIG